MVDTLRLLKMPERMQMYKFWVCIYCGTTHHLVRSRKICGNVRMFTYGVNVGSVEEKQKHRRKNIYYQSNGKLTGSPGSPGGPG